MITPDQFIAAATKHYGELVKVKDLAGFPEDVYVRSMTADERDRLDLEVLAAKKDVEARGRHIRARIVALAACDKTGARIFADDDVERIGNLPGSAVEPIFIAASDLNRIFPADLEPAGN